MLGRVLGQAWHEPRCSFSLPAQRVNVDNGCCPGQLAVSPWATRPCDASRPGPPRLAPSHSSACGQRRAAHANQSQWGNRTRDSTHERVSERTEGGQDLDGGHSRKAGSNTTSCQEAGRDGYQPMVAKSRLWRGDNASANTRDTTCRRNAPSIGSCLWAKGNRAGQTWWSQGGRM